MQHFGTSHANRRIISGAVFDGMIENRGIRGQSGHGQLIDVTLEDATIKQVASDVVEPDALSPDYGAAVLLSFVPPSNSLRMRLVRTHDAPLAAIRYR